MINSFWTLFLPTTIEPPSILIVIRFGFFFLPLLVFSLNKYLLSINSSNISNDSLIPAFEKRKYEFTLQKGTTWDYTTIANADNSNVTGKATVIDTRNYYSDGAHAGRDGYEWREATVEFKMPTGCKVMLGYTDKYTGMEEYAVTNYITYSDGTRMPVVATESYKYDWEDDVCVSYGTLSVQVPEDYEDLVFYVSSADYALTGRVDPNIRFMEMK